MGRRNGRKRRRTIERHGDARQLEGDKAGNHHQHQTRDKQTGAACPHQIQTHTIVALTRQLQITLRGSDVIGRFGGDEFAVIMSGTPAESAITAMLRVHD